MKFKRIFAQLVLLLISSCINKNINSFFTPSDKGTINDSVLTFIAEVIFINDYYDDVDKMLQIADSTLSKYPYHPINESVKLKIQGHHNFKKGNFNTSEEYFDKALEIARNYKQDFPFFYESILNNTAEISQILFKYDEATSYILELIYFDEQNKDFTPYKRASRIYQLANILYNKGDYLSCIDFLRESFTILQNDHPTSEEDLFDNYFLKLHIIKLDANAQFNLRLYDKALMNIEYAHYLKDSILRIEPESSEFIEPISRDLEFLRAYILINKQQYQQADSILVRMTSNQSKKIGRLRKNTYKSSYLLALSKARQNKKKDAMHLLDSLENIQPEILLRNDKYTSEIYHLISAIYEALEDYKNAFIYHKLSTDITDSIKVITLLSNSVNTTKEYLDLTKKISEEKLTKDIQRSNFYSVLLMIISIALIVIITILYLRSVENKKYLTHERYLSNELKKTNEELRKSNNMLYQSELYNKFLLKYLAHDLRNPLSSIKGIVDIIRLEEDKKDLNVYLEMIETQATTSLEFITYLLKSSSTTLHKEKHSLNEVITSSIQTTSQSARKKNIFIKNNASDHLFCEFDYYKIWSLLNNLLSNAIKFSPRDSTIVIEAHKKPSTVVISIRDNGIGMSQSQIDKILSNDIVEGREGTEGEISYGIGLKISKQIVDQHNGTLKIQSEEGKGSTFIIELPCDDDSDNRTYSNNPTETLGTS